VTLQSQKNQHKVTLASQSDFKNVITDQMSLLSPLNSNDRSMPLKQKSDETAEKNGKTFFYKYVLELNFETINIKLSNRCTLMGLRNGNVQHVSDMSERKESLTFFVVVLFRLHSPLPSALEFAHI
jgi:hypothetical protein